MCYRFITIIIEARIYIMFIKYINDFILVVAKSAVQYYPTKRNLLSKFVYLFEKGIFVVFVTFPFPWNSLYVFIYGT